MKVYPTLDLTSHEVVLGNHCVWLPNERIKVPFQWGGKTTKLSKHEACYSIETIIDEVSILRALAAKRMAPPVGEFVFFKEVVSTYPGAWHCDPCGAYGYELADAMSLPPGLFSLEAMMALPITGTPGAWGDIGKAENIVNGYLVDARRSGWDRLHWMGERVALPDGREAPDLLAARVHRECQFPAGERAEAYQDFWVAGRLQRGQRRVVERAGALGFSLLPGDSVLDIGCQSGGFLQFASLQVGATGRLVGVDVSPAYVDCARAIARSCGQNINIRNMDVVAERHKLLEWVRAYFHDGVDHLLLLSMEKHLGEGSMFDLVDAIGARHTYIETNAVAKVPDRERTATEAFMDMAPMKLLGPVVARGGRHVGDSTDRNLRRLYRIDSASA